MPDGFLTSLKKAGTAPSDHMTYTQLAAATVFVLIVILLWRQVTFFIMGEL